MSVTNCKTGIQTDRQIDKQYSNGKSMLCTAYITSKNIHQVKTDYTILTTWFTNHSKRQLATRIYLAVEFTAEYQQGT